MNKATLLEGGSSERFWLRLRNKRVIGFQTLTPLKINLNIWSFEAKLEYCNCDKYELHMKIASFAGQETKYRYSLVMKKGFGKLCSGK